MCMYFCIVATVGLLALHLAFERKRYQGRGGAAAAGFKVLASTGMVATCLSSAAHMSTGGTYLLGALILCAVGDVLLISTNTRLFRMGLAVFLTAHLSYCFYFLKIGIDSRPTLLAAPVLIIAGVGILKWLVPHLEKSMRFPVTAYVIVICTMVAFSIGAARSAGHLILPVAATLFMISDLLVAKERFIASSFTNRLISLPLYYSAQLLFAVSPWMGI